MLSKYAMNVPVEWMVHQLNELMKSQTSLPKPELFCYNEEYWKTLQLLLKNLIPGYNFFSMLHNVINRHFEVGEKYLEILLSPCVDTCEKYI